MSVFEEYDSFEDNLTPVSEIEKESDLPADLVYSIALYLKVGLFCGWDWESYINTPLWVIDSISEEIDKRLKPYIDSMTSKANSSAKKGPDRLPLNYMHLSILLGLAAMSGGDD